MPPNKGQYPTYDDCLNACGSYGVGADVTLMFFSMRARSSPMCSPVRILIFPPTACHQCSDIKDLGCYSDPQNSTLIPLDMTKLIGRPIMRENCAAACAAVGPLRAPRLRRSASDACQSLFRCSDIVVLQAVPYMEREFACDFDFSLSRRECQSRLVDVGRDCRSYTGRSVVQDVSVCRGLDRNRSVAMRDCDLCVCACVCVCV